MKELQDFLSPVRDHLSPVGDQRSLAGLLDELNRLYPSPSGWPDGDWPVNGHFHPSRLEVAVGAVLTQNTAWRNVQSALANLVEAGLVEARTIAEAPQDRLEQVIRPAGFFRQKAACLKRLMGLVRDPGGSFFHDVTRERLLAVKGIGPETADSILLYACGRPVFVVDAYTLRILSRYGLVPPDASYESLRRYCEAQLRRETILYRRGHALLVEHARQLCRKKPLCGQCRLRPVCPTGMSTGGDRSGLQHGDWAPKTSGTAPCEGVAKVLPLHFWGAKARRAD